MHSYAIKSLTFRKLGDFSIEYRNFSKFSEPAAPKMCHLTQFFPKNFQMFPFFSAFGAVKCVTERQSCPPPLAIGPPSVASLKIILPIIALRAPYSLKTNKNESTSNEMNDFLRYVHHVWFSEHRFSIAPEMVEGREVY